MPVKYLATANGEKHLPYTDESGKPDHRLMGAAWAALHGGYRGNKYEGPGKEDAIARLRSVYQSEKMPIPGESLRAGDGFVFDALEMTSRTITPEGFLVAPATIARTGVQLYRAGEIGIGKDSGMDPMTIVRMHRPSEEVNDPESVGSFENNPVTLNHPAGNRVTADNWKRTAVGDMSGVHGSGSTLDGKITVRDKDAVDAVVQGKKYLSAGYSFTLDPTPGTTADGQEYDAVMRKIRGNHVAIVDSPRGGPVCRIADSNTQRSKTMRKFVVDGISVEIEDGTAADVFTKLQTALDAATQKLSGKIKVGDKEFSLTDSAAIQTAVDALASNAITPAQLEQCVATRVKLVGDAQKLVSNFVVDGKSDVQIQREVISAVIAKDEAAKAVVDAVLAGVAVDTADPTMLAAAFRALSAAPKGTVKGPNAADAAMAAALNGKTATDAKVAPTGRDVWIQRNNDAWMGENKQQ